MNTLRTLNHRFFRLRPRALGGALVATGAVLLGGGLTVGGPGASIGAGIVAVHADSNHGDFWVQDGNSDPKAEEPHLDCDTTNDPNITLWGTQINGTTGTFEIDLISPSGSGVAYNGTWRYNLTGTDPQAIASIKKSDLVAGAVVLGATANSKLHFKISLPIFPNKHKTFWMGCDGSSTTSSSSSTTTDTTSQTTTLSSTTTTDSTTTSTTTTDPTTTSTTTDPTTTSTTTDNSTTSSGSTQTTTSAGSTTSTTTDHTTTSSTTDHGTTSSSTTTDHGTTSSSTTTDPATTTGDVGGTGAGNPPGTGAGTTTTSSTAGAPATSTAAGQQPVVVHQLSVPEAGADIPFVPGFLLLLAGGGLLAADVRRGRRARQQ